MNDRKRNVSFIRVKTQFENVGDALINRELISKISQNSDLYIDFSNAPDKFIIDIYKSIFKINRINFGFIEILIRSIFFIIINRSVFYFYIPSGLIGEKSGFHFTLSKILNLAFKIMNHLGVTFVHLGASYSRLGPNYISLLRDRLSITKVHLVRDAGTVEYLKSVGLRCDGLVPDMSFGLYDQETEHLQKDAIAFSFRVDRSPDERHIIEAFVKDIVARTDPNELLLFVSQVRRDDEFLSGLAAKYANSRKTEFIGTDAIEPTLDVYGRVKLIYSNRLHSLLMAAYKGAIPVAVVDDKKDEKIIGIFEDFGMTSNIVYPHEEGNPINAIQLDRGACMAENKRLEYIVRSVFG